VAEAYARQAVRGVRGRLRWTMAAIGGVASGVGVSVWIWSRGAGADVVTVAAVLVFLACVAVPVLRVSLLLKVEMANKMALAPAGAPAPAPAPAPASPEGTPAPGDWAPAGRELAVRYRWGRILRQLGPLFGIGCLFLVYGLLIPNPVTASLLVLVPSSLLIAVTVLAAIRVLRWGLRRPILRLDADGVHIPRYRYTLPWPELAEVRLIPLRAFRRGGGQPTMIVAFVPADPQAALRALRANGGGRRLEKSCRLYGTPLTLADRLTDQPADQITAAASAFAPVPVSRY
jgi:hypothetical protein